MKRLLVLAALLASCGSDRSTGGTSATGNSVTARVTMPNGSDAVGDSVYLRVDSVGTATARLRISDQNGRVEFTNVPSGAWTLEARGLTTGRLVRLNLREREEKNVSLATAPYSTLAGQILLPAGAATAQVLLQGTGIALTSDSLGKFNFSRVSPGTQLVAALPRSDRSLGAAVWSSLLVDSGASVTLEPKTPSKTRSSDWTLAWTENFDQTSKSIWQIDTGNGCPQLCGWGIGALQRYDTANAFVRNGELILRAEKQGDQWHSGQVRSRGLFEFQYGRIEFLARMPAVRGAWSLIALQGDSTPGPGWPEGGAIDVASLWGYRADSLMGIGHRNDQNGLGLHPGAVALSNQGWGDRWVTFAVEWTPAEIIWFADDQVFHRMDAGPPFDHPFYLAMNLTVGGDGNAAPDSLQSPFEFAIDNIRLYRR
jgi:beta-glucanase (GH16 family)